MSTGRYIGVGVLVLLGFWVEKGLGEGWEWSSRLDLSYVRDSNVFESISEPMSDHTGRFLFQLSGGGRPIKPVVLSFRYSGGLQGYGRYSMENRMVNDVKSSCEIPFWSRASLGVEFQGRDKTFFQIDRGYRFWQGSSFVRWTFPSGLRAELFYAFSLLDYVEGVNFDYDYRGGGVLLEMALMPRVTWEFQFVLGESRYERTAFGYEKTDDYTYQWIDRGRVQEDDLQEVSTTLEVYQWALVQFGYSYQWNLSNSYGYSYNQPQLNVLVAKTLPWGLAVRFYWVLQMKDYTDSLTPLLQIRPDTENEENSFTLVDLSKDLMQNLSLRFRLGWYKNESPFRDRYYKKNLISMGFTQRF